MPRDLTSCSNFKEDYNMHHYSLSYQYRFLSVDGMLSYYLKNPQKNNL